MTMRLYSLALLAGLGMTPRAGIAACAPTVVGSQAYASPSGANDEGRAVCIDGSGNIIVAGTEEVGGYERWRIRKYDASLSGLLASTFYGPAEDLADRLYDV